jgi:hypothetical protein
VSAIEQKQRLCTTRGICKRTGAQRNLQGKKSRGRGKLACIKVIYFVVQMVEKARQDAFATVSPSALGVFGLITLFVTLS